MPDMDRLVTFVAVVDHGSFRKAASTRFLSHSTVQKQMRSLERDVGFPLFERSGRGVVLKPRANDLADAARHALQACADLQHNIDHLRNSEQDNLRVTAAPVHMANKLGVAIRHVQETAGFKVQPVMRSHEELLDEHSLAHLLRSGATDVVVSVRALAGCQTQELWPLELVAVVPVAFAQTLKRGLSVTSLAGMTVFAQDAEVWSRRHLDTLAEQCNVRLNVVTEPMPEVCVSLARAGMGVAIVADDNVAPDSRDVLPLIDPRGKRIEGSVKANWLAENDSANLRAFLSFF